MKVDLKSGDFPVANISAGTTFHHQFRRGEGPWDLEELAADYSSEEILLTAEKLWQILEGTSLFVLISEPLPMPKIPIRDLGGEHGV